MSAAAEVNSALAMVASAQQDLANKEKALSELKAQHAADAEAHQAALAELKAQHASDSDAQQVALNEAQALPAATIAEIDALRGSAGGFGQGTASLSTLGVLREEAYGTV